MNSKDYNYTSLTERNPQPDISTPEMRTPSPSSAEDTGVPMPDTGQVTEAEFTCNVCGQVFQSRRVLEEHQKSHEEIQKRVVETDQAAGVQ